MEAKIEKVENGYKARYLAEDGVGVVRRVYQERYEEDERVALVNMLQDLVEYFGVCNSEHNEYNLNIEVIKNV